MRGTASTEFSFEGKQISEKKMLKVWKSLTSKPFPSSRINAYLLENEEMDRVLSILKKSPNIQVQSMWEYGKRLSVEESDAVIFYAKFVPRRIDYCILIKEDGNFTLDENLKHELEHIAKGEVSIHQGTDGKE